MTSHNQRINLIVGLIALILAALGCNVPTPTANTDFPLPAVEVTAPATLTLFIDTPALTYFSLLDATYTLGGPSGGAPYTLSSGSYSNDAEMIYVNLSSILSVGDLNGDGAADAAAILYLNTGGSGTFVNLAPVLNRGGLPHSTGNAGLGDRIYVHNIRIREGGLITMDMTVTGPDDPLCCPTLQTTQTYRLDGETVSFVGEEFPTKRLTIDSLQNATISTDFGTFALASGLAEDTSGVQPIHVTLGNITGYGDLNGDGLEDAAAIVTIDGGGTGRFPYLLAMINEGGTPINVASVALGDREVIHNVNVGSDGTITIEATAHTPDDGGCCPSTYMLWHYKLEGGALVSRD